MVLAHASQVWLHHHHRPIAGSSPFIHCRQCAGSITQTALSGTTQPEPPRNVHQRASAAMPPAPRRKKPQVCESRALGLGGD